MLPQQIEVDKAIVVRIKDTLAIISSLRDVVRQTYSDHSGNSGHLKMSGMSGALLARNRDLRSPSLISPALISPSLISPPDFPEFLRPLYG